MVVNVFVLVGNRGRDPLALLFPVGRCVLGLRVGPVMGLLSASLAFASSDMSARRSTVMTDVDPCALELLALDPKELVAVDPSRALGILVVDKYGVVARAFVAGFHAVDPTASGRMCAVEIQQAIVLARSADGAVFASEETAGWE